MENLTPMLSQYKKIKSQYPDSILFFRLGDFYEMFYDDARKASAILDVVLTSRDAGKAGKAPMCGIPYHAAESYIARLIKAGLKVAICEQVEDPSKAKGLVKREVVRVITSGTFIDETTAETRNIACLFWDKKVGLAITDIASGTIQTNEFNSFQDILVILTRLPVYEIVLAESQEEKVKGLLNHFQLRNRSITVSSFVDWAFNIEIASKSLCEHFHTSTLDGFGIAGLELSIRTSGALLEYLKSIQKQPLRHIDRLCLITDEETVYISNAACYGLELDLLFKTIDYTQTALGKRKLRNWLFHPLKNIQQIILRQQAVSLIKENTTIQNNLRQLLSTIADIEKSLSRISGANYTVKDLINLRSALNTVPQLQQVLAKFPKNNPLFVVHDLPSLRQYLNCAINPDIPVSHPEGKIINSGFNQELDQLRQIKEHGTDWLKNLQAQQIQRTGISSLKIGFNSVFGYYFEVSKTNLERVPADFIRKQTLVNAERFITAELKEFEEKMLTAESRILEIEKNLLKEVQETILDNASGLHQIAQDIATIDCLYALSILANTKGYTLPRINEGLEIIIKEGRHPVVEKTLNEPFIANDTLIDTKDNHLIILTGPNMAGKSTYIRQVACLVILAQIGSFIPAEEATIGIVDKIFTRIGAHDEITKGMSTFMVEMSEAAGILNNLSERSLVILDEVGRGTSTFDGLSLAWAIAEFLAQKKIRTLFATHFHELTALSEEFSGVKNYNVAVKKWQDKVIFLHKIVPGGTDDSYGIYVAKLAGIPQEVVARAQKILTRLELETDLQQKIRNEKNIQQQLWLFNQEDNYQYEQIIKQLKELDLNNLTPVEAIQILAELQKKAKTNG
ncbi:MAG: DNA mismatch repair protein MutS [Candidatus Omnitrophica bacterium]|nr:DNA mismatch repair protein MutS [Candidatus Omnitrophota bacterium]